MKRLANAGFVLLAVGLLCGCSGWRDDEMDGGDEATATPTSPLPEQPLYERPVTYHYYPDSGIYYDTDRKVYFFPYERGWREGSTLPPPLHAEPGQWVEVKGPQDKPYLAFETHRRAHPPGSLLPR